mmetsp:Transcript_33370/g.51894  ORF Transcript_33370/g.51894 Transcript_33370/m.51894 type:complete len:468 (+) Transcript_33370:1324-2727(+)
MSYTPEPKARPAAVPSPDFEAPKVAFDLPEPAAAMPEPVEESVPVAEKSEEEEDEPLFDTPAAAGPIDPSGAKKKKKKKKKDEDNVQPGTQTTEGKESNTDNSKMDDDNVHPLEKLRANRLQNRPKPEGTQTAGLEKDLLSSEDSVIGASGFEEVNVEQESSGIGSEEAQRRQEEVRDRRARQVAAQKKYSAEMKEGQVSYGTQIKYLHQKGVNGGVIQTGGYTVTTKSRHNRLPRDVLSWNGHHVGVWLGRQASTLGSESVAEYQEIFRKYEVHGSHFISLKVRDLVDMGITSITHAKALISAIHKAVMSDSHSTPSKPLDTTHHSGMALTSVTDSWVGKIQKVGHGGTLTAPTAHGLALSSPSPSNALTLDAEPDQDNKEMMKWKEILSPTVIQTETPKRRAMQHILPDDDLFENPINRPKPYANLPTIETKWGNLRVYTQTDLKRENAHLELEGPCPFECRCCV